MMGIDIVEKGDRTIIEGVEAIRLLQSPEDATEIIGTCFEHRARLVLLYAENLTERFFDLSSGDAGTILQKFRNYGIKVAVVAPQGEIRQSNRFREMMAEERQGGDFRIFDDKASAEAWLIGV